ncbi:hypothetical protein E0M29_23655 [Bacillus cereus]|uniref:hypothetical protein n=1 Tax=Bacillus cereus TaxID=1396 RepID=UPI00103D133E|nr:hypothetical protein [Bacillus cereus]TBX86169.1 hypothetical protein E0M29_23655 [Bacillus cereus]
MKRGQKTMKNIEGLSCGIIFFDEAEQDLAETLRDRIVTGKSLDSKIIENIRRDIKLMGGIDWAEQDKDITYAANPKLLVENEKRELFAYNS